MRVKAGIAKFMVCNLFTVMFVTGAIQASNTKLQNSRWTTVETNGIPAPRHENAFVECGGKFYLIGGRGVKPVCEYDPQTKTWKDRNPVPIEMHHFQAVAVDSVIYVVGAMTGKYPVEQPLSHIYIYNPRSDSWQKGAEIPVERRRGGCGAVLYNNKIYMVGGIKLGHTAAQLTHLMLTI